MIIGKHGTHTSKALAHLLVVIDEVRVRHVDDLFRVVRPALRGYDSLISYHIVHEVRSQCTAEPEVGDLEIYVNYNQNCYIVHTIKETARMYVRYMCTSLLFQTYLKGCTL